MAGESKNWYSTGQIAKKHSVTNKTVQDWIKKGRYKTVKRTVGGHYRVFIEDAHQIQVIYHRPPGSVSHLCKAFPSAHKAEELYGTHLIEAIVNVALRGLSVHLIIPSADTLVHVNAQFVKHTLEAAGGQVEIADNSIIQPASTEALAAFICSRGGPISVVEGDLPPFLKGLLKQNANN